MITAPLRHLRNRLESLIHLCLMPARPAASRLRSWLRYCRSCRPDHWLRNLGSSMEKTPRSGSRVMRIGVASEDATLTVVLSSVLGSDFTVSAAPPLARIAEPGIDSRYDALIVDFDSSTYSSRAFFGAGVSQIGVPVVIMASDESRTYALDLVERGAYGYIRKPPVVRELRTMLLSACESRFLKGELA